MMDDTVFAKPQEVKVKRRKVNNPAKQSSNISSAIQKIDSLIETIYSIIEMDKKITARIETLEKQNKKLRILLAEKNDKENVLRRMLAEKKVEEEKLKEENMQLRSLLAERSEKDREVDVVLETSEKGSESNDETVVTLVDENKKMKNKTNLQDEDEFRLANRQHTAAYQISDKKFFQTSVDFDIENSQQSFQQE